MAKTRTEEMILGSPLCLERDRDSGRVRGQVRARAADLKKTRKRERVGEFRQIVRFGRIVTGSALVLVVAVFLVAAQMSEVYAKDDATDLFDVGQAHLANGRFQEAVEALTQCLLKLGPDSKDAVLVLLARSQAYVRKGDLDLAKADLNRAMSEKNLESATRAVALHVMGNLRIRQGQVEDALEAFTNAIKTPHDDVKIRARSFSHRGTVFFKLKDYDRALSDLNKAIDLDPEASGSYAWRGASNLGKGDLEKAERDARKSLAMNHDDDTEKVAKWVLTEVAKGPADPMAVNDVVTLPVDRNGHVFVTVCFKKGGSQHRFMLDTGATHSLVSDQLLKIMKDDAEVKVIGRGISRTADGKSHAMTRYLVKTAYLMNSEGTGGLPLGEIEVQALEGSQPLTNLLGIGSLQKISFSIDTARRVIELRRNDSQRTADGPDGGTVSGIVNHRRSR
jgi:tetratricopeptide (TPR) repeat protein